MPHTHKSIAITDRSSVGEARRSAMGEALMLGFNEEERSNIGIVATEAAANALLHGQGGEFLVCPVADGDHVCLDLIAVDSGPGIADIPRAMEDGYSTLGTAGHGLGAIGRIAHKSSLFSMTGKGTAYWSRFLTSTSHDSCEHGIVNIPIKGETFPGDSFTVDRQLDRTLYMVVDGLGHGAGAAEAAGEAVRTVKQYAASQASEIIERTHDALKKTRGAAMSLAIIDADSQSLTYAGIGNISGMLVSPGQSRSLISQNGTLGAILPRAPQEYVYPVGPSTTLVMFSDGLTSKVSLAGYPGLLNRPAPLIAGVLYRDFSRKRDDATILVAPLGKPS